MALANDPAFLIYQLRVSFLRSNDPTGERILTFDDLSVVAPTTGPANSTRMRQGSSIPSPLTTPPAARRNTSASEVRQHVAQNAAANPYIAASGFYPETEAVGSPEIEYDEGYMFQRPAVPRWGAYGAVGGGDGADMPTPSARHLPDRAGHAGRNKRSNRSAKVAPTMGGGGQVVGLGVVPQDHEMMLADIDAQQPPTATRRSFDTVQPRPLPVLQEVANSSGSLSDGNGARDMDATTDGPEDWGAPKPIVVPPRRSLDTIHHQRSESTAQRPTAAERRRQQGHAHSNSVATIRLQRPAEMLRKGSSRDAIALGIDFDVTTIFEKGASDSQQSIYDLQYQNQGDLPENTTDMSSQQTVGDAGSAEDADTAAQRPPQGRDGSDQQPANKGTGSIELRAKRGELTFKLPQANPREDQRFGSAASGGLKRSVTLPTRRNMAGGYGPGGSSGFGGGAGAAGNAARRSKWAGAYAFGRKQQQQQQQQGANQASGWVGGAHNTSWDHSSDDDDGEGADSSVPFSRRGGGTQTWYGPRAGIRPISMFPAPTANAQFPIPPVPLMFGDDDSDDDIDLEGDEGSSRTPALMGLGLSRGLRPQAPSPNSSIRSRGNSVGLAPEQPRAARFVPKPSALATTSGSTSSPLSATLTTPAVVSGAKYNHLTQDAATLRPRGISDPEGRQSSRGSKSGELISGAGSGIDEPQLAVASGLGSASRQDTLRPASSSGGGDMLVSSRALEFGLNRARSGRLRQPDAADSDAVAVSEFVPPSPPKTSGLGALLSGKMEVQVNPFAEEFSTVGGGGNSTNNNNLLEVNLDFIQHKDEKSPPLKIHVRRNATIEQAVGFALYQYIEQNLRPQLAAEAQDVVMWVLRIVEDGEVDDDLPALERTRPVANFAFDDLALCLATPDQVKQNEAVRERLGRPPRMVRPKSLITPASISSVNASKKPQNDTPGSGSPKRRDIRYNIVPRPPPTAAVLQVSRMATTSLAGIFVGNLLLDRRKTSVLPPLTKGSLSNQSIIVQDSASAGVSAALCEPRLLKIRILGEAKSAEESLRATTVETDTGATMGMVLAQVCRKKPFSEDRFVLGVIGPTGFVVYDSEMRVSQIPDGAELCLYKVGAAQSAADVAESDACDRELAPIYGQQRADESGAAVGAIEGEAGEAAMSSIYYTFRVFRRAQMFTRHERSLVIDGGVVTLMPSGHRTESAKTLTFHVSNIICKRNQKSPKKIRLFVTRHANTGEKSIDLEATTEEEATNICTVLTRMHEYYRG
ncbi:Component of a membrane-bound complex containing the Tor2p kinase [Coemansia sp. RSA 1933]|nr:Component of a membrane-bound complex containing the Tor2p kinase [Coemansia sp. RSA 1933]